jgi:hypothetical protein
MASAPGTVFSQPDGSFVEIGILPAGTTLTDGEAGGSGSGSGTTNRDRTVAYRCDTDLVTIDSFIRFETPYVYDLQYSCSNSVDIAMQDVSEKILVAAASEYNILPPGTGCAVPPTTISSGYGTGTGGGRSNWIAGAFSNTPDVLVPNIPCLVATDADLNECCRVVEGAMQFQPSGGYEGDEFRDFVANTLKESSFASGETFQTTYRGATIDYTYTPAEDPRDQLESETEDPRDTSISAIGNAENQQTGGDGNKVTAMGGALLSGLVVAFIGVLFIVFRRRRQNRYDDEDLEANMSNTDMDAAEGHETLQLDLQLDVLSDSNMERNHSPRRNQERYIESPSHSNAYEYKFDLSSSMKNDVMGTYGAGPTSMAVTAPYGISGEASDNGSEVDSWAQTDGTVGSLEDNLDEITAEI